MTSPTAPARTRLACVALALLGASAPLPETPPDPVPLAWCLERARRVNPDLDAARHAAEAAEARVYPAGALPDPRFRYELSNVPTGDLDLDSTPLSGQQLGLTQHFPFPGLLGRQREAARQAAAASQELVGTRRRAWPRRWSGPGWSSASPSVPWT